jgi:hypothetical protein
MSGRGFLAIWSDIDAAAETDYLHWMIREHAIERVSVPGFLGMRMFRALQGDVRRFFILYELEAPDVVGGAAYLARLNSPTPWSQRIMPQLQNFIRGGGSVAAAARWLSGPSWPVGSLVVSQGAGVPHLPVDNVAAPGCWVPARCAVPLVVLGCRGASGFHGERCACAKHFATPTLRVIKILLRRLPACLSSVSRPAAIPISRGGLAACLPDGWSIDHPVPGWAGSSRHNRSKISPPWTAQNWLRPWRERSASRLRGCSRPTTRKPRLRRARGTCGLGTARSTASCSLKASMKRRSRQRQATWRRERRSATLQRRSTPPSSPSIVACSNRATEAA